MVDTSWIEEKTIEELHEKLGNGETTSRELVLTYLTRIATIDSSGPSLRSIIELNPDALHLADKLDAERKNGKDYGVLHGIPLVIKDNIDTSDKMHTSAGSLLLKDHYAKEDAFVVKQLRKAGAILLGKTNLTEWANFIAQDMPTGYSSRGGQTLNPYGKKFMVGGSSAGSGAAVATNLVTAAIGTETSGSILCPASQNSIVGVKPTVGLISRSGVIPISHIQDTAGPMTRTVSDAALLLNVLQGVDEQDPITATNPLLNTDFKTFLKKDGLKGKRIGIVRKPYFNYLDKDQTKILSQSIAKLEDLGAQIIDDVAIPSEDKKWDINVMIYEFKAAIENYLKTVDSKFHVTTLNDLIQKNSELGSKALKYGQARFLQSSATSGNLTESDYLQSLIHDQVESKENGIDALLKKHELDAIVTPNYFGAMIPAKAGYPSITVPAGYSQAGEPLGLTFSASAFSESVLLECAYAFEQGTHFRKAPKL